ncbi:hypothetical protein LCM4573_05860 [Rhizobium sp. LCM 4573]|nr:hypothetical protein LCM4573_05860 [Rhizobium sp. LCM 4573]
MPRYQHQTYQGSCSCRTSLTIDECLPLLESGAQTADFGLERGHVADSSHSDTPEIVSTTTCFGEFRRILICRALLTALFGSLLSGSVGISKRTDDACSQEAEFESGSSGGVSAREDRHTQHSC